mmetsp:Transcript_8708/g.35632  ORF Transcript_8708/g.35632 Transcript_8708/m.35632 type:complete len:201 (-) Transcript_8708:3675-4277(-)
MRPGSIAPSSPRHCAASLCTFRDNAVRPSPAKHLRSAATSLPTTRSDQPASPSPPARSAETAAGSARSARRSSPSAVARTAWDSSSEPSVSVASREGRGTSPRSRLTAALALARLSHAGSMGRRARCPRMQDAPLRSTSSSITSAAAEALSTPDSSSPTPAPTSLPRREPRSFPEFTESGRWGSMATTTRPATRLRWSGA